MLTALRGATCPEALGKCRALKSMALSPVGSGFLTAALSKIENSPAVSSGRLGCLITGSEGKTVIRLNRPFIGVFLLSNARVGAIKAGMGAEMRG